MLLSVVRLQLTVTVPEHECWRVKGLNDRSCLQPGTIVIMMGNRNKRGKIRFGRTFESTKHPILSQNSVTL